MSAVEMLDKELQSILNETKKKYPAIKDMVGECIVELQNYKKKLSPNQATHRGLSELAVQPFFKMIDALKDIKQLKIQESGLAVLQKLLNQTAGSETDQEIALTFLHSMKDIKDEKVQIKLIQSLLVMLNPKVIICKNYSQIEKILNICLTLQGQKDIIVHNTSLSGIFQLVSIVFDHFVKSRKATEVNYSENSQTQSIQSVEEETKEQSSIHQSQENKRSTEEDFLGMVYSPKSCQDIALACNRLLGDIISVMEGKNLPGWVPNLNGLSPTYQEIGFDLILAIFKQAGRQISAHKEMSAAVHTRLVTFAMDNIKSDYPDYKFGIRVLKLCSRLAYNIRGNKAILVKMMNAQKQCQKIYVFSYVFAEHSYICLNDTRFLKHLNSKSSEESLEEADRQKNGILYLLEGIAAIATILSKLPNAEIRKVVNSNVKQKIVDRNEIDFHEPPQISLNMLYKLLVDNATNFTQSLVRIFQDREQELALIRQRQQQQAAPQEGIAELIHTNSNKHSEGFEELMSIIEGCWKENLRIIKKLLMKHVNEQHTQNILKQIQSWINLAGTLELHKISDEYLRILSLNCVGEEYTSFNLLCTKVLFNIALCLGNILGTSSWHIILQTMQKLDSVFQRKLFPEEAVRKEDQLINSEIQIQQNILNNLFSTSHQADDSLIVTIIDALNQVNLSVLEVAAIEQTQKRSGDFPNQKFGLIKMQETVVVNIFRVELFWDLVATHFLMLANKKYNDLRLFSIDILNNIINSAFNFFLTIYTLHEQPSQQQHEAQEELQELNHKFSNLPQWNEENWQETLLNPYREIIASQFPDTKLTLLENCLRLLQNNGHAIKANGLKVILDVLRQVSGCVEFPNVVIQGQKILELIISQYISIINRDQLKVILDLIENFRKNSVDSNSIYQSVTLIWNIGDHLAKLNETLLKSSEPLNSQPGQSVSLIPLISETTQADGTAQQTEDPKTNINNLSGNISQFEELWESIFSKLIVLTNEGHNELRQSAIQTLSQLFTVNTRFFKKKFWIKIVKEVIISQIDKLIQKIIKQNEEQMAFFPEAQSAHLQTPKFFGIPETPKFLLPSLSDRNLLQQLPVHYTERFDAKSVEASIMQLVQSLQKIIKKGLTIPTIDENLIDLYMTVISKLKLVIILNSQELILEFFKILKDFATFRPVLALKIFEEIKLVFLDYLALMDFLGDCKEENKVASTQVIPLISEIYISLLKMDSSDNLTLALFQSFTEFFKQGLGFCKRIDQLPQGYIKFVDDKPIFNLLDQFTEFNFSKSFSFQNQFLLFLNEVINLPVECRFDYLMIKKFIGLFTAVLLDQRLSEDLHPVFVKYLLARIENLLELRFDREYYALHAKFPKTFEPLWLSIFEYFLQLAKALIVKNNFDADFFFIMENLLSRPKDKISKLNGDTQIQLMNDIAKVESVCIEFIISAMLSEEQDLQQYVISRMIEVLENYTDSKKHENNLNFLALSTSQTQVPSNQVLLEENEYEVRRKYIQNLFLLGKNKKSKNPKFDEVSRVVMPILILRCKQIIEEFIIDEEQLPSTVNSLSKARVSELIFVLQQLKELELPFDCFKQSSEQINQKSMQLNNSNVSSASDLQQPQTKQNPPEVKIIEAILTKILEYFSNGEITQISLANTDGSPKNNPHQDENQSEAAANQQSSKKPKLIVSPEKKTASQRKYIIVDSDNPFIKGKRGHLVYMFSLFTGLIVTRNTEIKKHLQDIFRAIQTDMDLNNLFSDNQNLQPALSSPQFRSTSYGAQNNSEGS